MEMAKAKLCQVVFYFRRMACLSKYIKSYFKAINELVIIYN